MSEWGGATGEGIWGGEQRRIWQQREGGEERFGEEGGNVWRGVEEHPGGSGRADIDRMLGRGATSGEVGRARQSSVRRTRREGECRGRMGIKTRYRRG